METTLSSEKTETRRAQPLNTLSQADDITRGYKAESDESDRTAWGRSSNERVMVSTNDTSSATTVSINQGDLSGETRLIEVHEFIIAKITDTHASMEISIGDSTKTFLAMLKGLEDIGVVAPSVGDRFKLNILKTSVGYISRAIKISAAGGLAFPEVAPQFDPSYLDYLKKHLDPDKHE